MPNDKIKLNKLCCVEDWENEEINKLRQEWMPINLVFTGQIRPFLDIHRKFWEWALGIIAIRRLGKLNKNSIAIGVGSGKELPLFYLANKISHVYATDLYDGTSAEDQCPQDFPENPGKYAPFPFNEKALTISRMDGTDLSFDSNYCDIVFSFSSVEHFGGENHSGALKSLKEMERVLKPGGIAIVTTEYIINEQDHYEYFNKDKIYSDLIDNLDMKLVESLDLNISPKTLETVIDLKSEGWGKISPAILCKTDNVLFTSVMLVFQK